MGILNGSVIVDYFLRGRYNARRPIRYNVYVDGELMRYKGMITENLSRHDAEEAIAHTSINHLMRILSTIEQRFGGKPESIFVYMDGARVTNKVVNRPEFKFDASLIRRTFATFCRDFGMHIRQLDYGESELQMYLQRDIEANLNVFVTDDSDMMSICYGHRPSPLSSLTDAVELCVPNDTTEGIEDANFTYKSRNDEEEIRDSCLWIRCRRRLLAIGLDDCQDSIGYSPFVFRTFAALCGTDFTPPLFTESMIRGVMSADSRDREFVNSLGTKVNSIVGALIVVAVRNMGTIKRKEQSDDVPCDYDAIERLVSMYVDYVTTGVMSSDPIPRPCMSHACRQYIYLMKNRMDRVYTKTALRSWATNIALVDACENLERQLSLPSVDRLPSPPPAPKKRRLSSPIAVSNLCVRKRLVSTKNLYDRLNDV